MENNLTANSGAERPAYTKAVNLHRDILANAQLAADAFVEFCRGLKEMRDSKLYLELGYGDFEAYTTGAVGLKQRQAYSYISTFEKLGARFLQENAALGITKLELLASVPAIDREEVAEQNDLGGMSVAEVRALMDKYNETQEQLSFLKNQAEETGQFMTAAQERAEKAEREAAALVEEIRELKGGIAAEPEEPEDLAALREELAAKEREIHHLMEQLDEPVEASDEAVEKIRAEEAKRAGREAAEQIRAAKREADERIRAAKEKANKEIEAAREKAKQEAAAAEKRAQEIAKQQLEDSLREIEGEKAEALRRTAELEKKLQVAANPDTVSLNFHLEELQAHFGHVEDCLIRIAHGDPETGEKMKGAVKKILAALLETLGQ